MTQHTPPEPINPHRTVTDLQSRYRLIFDRFLAGETIVEIARNFARHELKGAELTTQNEHECVQAVLYIIDEEMKRLKARNLANGK